MISPTKAKTRLEAIGTHCIPFYFVTHCGCLFFLNSHDGNAKDYLETFLHAFEFLRLSFKYTSFSMKYRTHSVALLALLHIGDDDDASYSGCCLPLNLFNSVLQVGQGSQSHA